METFFTVVAFAMFTVVVLLALFGFGLLIHAIIDEWKRHAHANH